jgi:L-arabinonolactonase
MKKLAEDGICEASRKVPRMISSISAICIVDCRNTLGEGCVWDPRDNSLYWTDIEERRIYRLAGEGIVITFELPERAAFLLPRKTPGFIIGFASQIALCDSGFQSFTTVTWVEPELPQTRVNDAAVDPYGGIVFGTFDESNRQPVGGLYRLSASGNLTRLLSSVAIGNGLAFSPDGTLMYFADTAEGTIRRFRLGCEFDGFEEIDPLAGPAVAPGRPDGAVVDSEGCYWSARVWGGCLVRIAPDGRVLQRVDVPTKGPTCVALGGITGTRLFATTLRTRHTPEELACCPNAGGIFASDVSVRGEPQRLCAL